MAYVLALLGFTIAAICAQTVLLSYSVAQQRSRPLVMAWYTGITGLLALALVVAIVGVVVV